MRSSAFEAALISLCVAAGGKRARDMHVRERVANWALSVAYEQGSEASELSEGGGGDHRWLFYLIFIAHLMLWIAFMPITHATP